MIEGVNVLNTYDIVNPEWDEMAFLSVLGCCISVCLVVIIIYILLNSKQIQDTAVISVICGFFVLLSMFLSILGFTHLPENKYQTRYEVTISDDVNFNELNSRYEVVKQEGLIYTIVEKTAEGGRE